MAACDAFCIVVHGPRGHIGIPHAAVDPIAIGAQVVTNLQHVAREVDPLEPAIVSVTGFTAGEAVGIVPETAEISGGTNVFFPEVQELLERRIGEIATAVCHAHGDACTYDTRGYRAAVNDSALTAEVEGTARELFGADTVVAGSPVMPGEDFSAFQERAPGCFVLLGAANAEQGIVFDHHHPRFDIDEAALPMGVRLLAHAAVKLLAAARRPASTVRSEMVEPGGSLVMIHFRWMAPVGLAAPIEHADLNRKVYDHLRAPLLSGELRAGQRLNLNALAEQLGVSRSPVHQALTRLATEGLVDVRSRRGYYVTPVTSKAVVEEYDVRLALELMAAERAVGRVRGAQLAGLGEALEAIRATTGEDGTVNLGVYVETNQRFHRLQLGLAGNRALLSIYDNLRVSLLMERLLAGMTLDRQTAELLDEQHAALHDAYIDGDLPAAQRTIRAHVDTGRRLAVDAIEAAGGSR